MLDAGDVDGVADRAGDRSRHPRRRRPSARTRSRRGRRSPRSPRRCSSDRLRALSATPRTPVCDATTGRVAIARTSSIVAADACATSTSIPRASIRSTISRPASVSPPFSMPCADPPNALSKKWLGDIIRKPASATTSTLAGSSSSAWAPSIARSPAVIAGSGASGAPRTPPGPPRERMIVSRPSDRAAIASARAAMWSARGSRRRQVAGGQPSAMREQDHVVAAVVVALDVQVPRRLVEAARTWSATLPSMRRGTSTWPRVGRAPAGPGPTAASRRAGPRPTGARGAPAPGPRRRTAAGSAVTHSRASVRADQSRRRRRGLAAVAVGGAHRSRPTPSDEQSRRQAVTSSPQSMRAPGPRRGRPASGRRVRARRGRTRAAPPRPRVRRRAPGGARRSPRCRGAGRPSAA